MNQFPSKCTLLSGTTYGEVITHARKVFNDDIRRRTKRQPYVRSKYFKGDKVFMTVFWDHIMQKSLKERTKRLKLYKAAIDLLRNSTVDPESIIDAAYQQMALMRFYGVTKDGVAFCVQVKHDLRSGRKDFMSVFQRQAPNKKVPRGVA